MIMRRIALVLSLIAAAVQAYAQIPGGTGGSGGSSGVTSLSTSCPAQTGQPLTGVVTLPFGVGPVTRNPVAGASDTLLAADCGQTIEYTSGSAIAVTVPQAGSAGFLSGFVVSVTMKSGSGTATFTTTTSVFSNTNAVTFTLIAGQSATLQSDGTNWNVYGGSTNTVTGPASAVTGDIATFNGTTGKIIQDSGIIPSVSHPGYITGTSYWYPAISPGMVAGASGVAVINTVYCSSFSVPYPVTIKALGASITTLSAGGHYALAIYNSVAHRPGTLVDFAAPMSTASVALVNGAMNNGTDVLAPGAYWMCGTADNGTSVTLGLVATSMNNSLAIGSATEANVIGVSSLITGVSCLVASTTCGGSGTGWGIWSAGVFTWGNATAATWSNVLAAYPPASAFEVN